MRDKNILVTGGAGFIGSHLCEELLKENRVICVDNLSTGDCRNVEHLMGNKNFKFIEHDVSKPLELREKIDLIFHMASPASPVDYQKLPIETMMVNSFGTYNMLNLAKKKKSRFLLASTSEVYGDPEEHPQKESYWGHVNPTGPRSCYDESKRFAEALVLSYSKTYGIDVRIARIFNTYGPRMRKNDGRAVPNFVTQALNNEPVTVYGDGKQTRSFCYISDMVEGLIKLMGSDVKVPVNLGNPSEMNILEVAERVKKMTNSDSEIVFRDLPKDDPVRRKPNIEKAKKEIVWEPKIMFEEGLEKTIEWFEKEV
ncbi:MAG: SDR family oxidoreductase [Candidatus Aenigmarchaeota archaeon]|nr:SDR family oxidoreductase [Candidatus Aenigmarchaeota archaeon]